MNWLLIRGLAREKRHWANFPETFKEKFPNDKIHFFDLPGVATKSHEDPRFSISAYTDYLREDFLKLKEDNDGPWGIIAISLGGMIAMNWASRFNDFEKVMVINSSAGNLSHPLKRLSLDAIKMIGKLFFRNDVYEREKAVLELTTNMTVVNDELVKKWESYSLEMPLSRKSFIAQVYAASKFVVPKSVHGEITFFVGEKDRLAHPECSTILSNQFNAPLYKNQNAGHDLPLDDPKWLCEMIERSVNS